MCINATGRISAACDTFARALPPRAGGEELGAVFLVARPYIFCLMATNGAGKQASPSKIAMATIIIG